MSVFDVAQTDGQPLPEFPTGSIAGTDHGEILNGLRELAAELSVSVIEKDLTAMSAGGWFDSNAQEIVIDSAVSTDEQVRTLTHELCHAQGVGYDLGRARAEVIVEAAATVALSSLGFDTASESLPYIASWGERDDLAALREDLAKIDEVAGRIEAACGVVETA